MTQPPGVARCGGHMSHLGMAIATEEGPNLVAAKGIASTVLGVLDVFLGKRGRFSGFSMKNKMKPTNPNAHTYVNGTDVKTHGYAVTHNTFLQ